MTSVPPTQHPAAKCDYCDQRATTLAGDTNGVLVCEDHVRLFAEREIAAAIDAARHPAAPEGETDASGLRELLRLATPAPWGVAGVDGQGFAVHRGEHETVALYCDRDNARLIAAAVNALPALLADLDTLRERLRVVEGERDAVVEVGAYAQQKQATARAVNNAARMAQVAARRTRELATMTARAESAEAAHEALRAGVEALADQFDGYGHGVYCTHMEEQLPCSTCRLLADLRALLAGGGA